MSTVLFYTTGGQGFQEAFQLEEAIENQRKGNNVFYLSCDHAIGGCLENPLYNKAICCKCEFFQRQRAKKYLLNMKDFHTVSEFCSERIYEKILSVAISYDSIEEFREIQYEGVEIGYGALSSYISLTRNMNPTLTNEVRRYLDALLYQQILLIEVLKTVFALLNPDLLVFHNGRFAQYKPILGLAQKKNINFICTESYMLSETDVRKCYFYNDIPHSAKANNLIYNSIWESYLNIEERDRLARSFFEKRRNALYAGDKIYVKDQKEGKLPDCWDKSKKNIVIFNSSEDEFCAVNREVDECALFPSQILGIKTILERYKNRNDFHFYLRIHPNLAGVEFDYHTGLYELNYSNLTVISADSEVSSYGLMDAADEIIVFGSTIGVEAAYWGKRVICLGFAFYRLLEVVYVPNTVDELWQMIENDNLPSLYNENTLKYGLFYVSDHHERSKYVNCNMRYYNIFGKKYQIPSYQTLFNSTFLYLVFNGLYRRFIALSFLFSRFKRVPIK